MRASFTQAAVAASAMLASTAAAIDPIQMKGAKLFYENGTQFFIKGVAYQQEAGGATGGNSNTYKDPLADAAACQKDVPLLEALGTNVIRTYAINPKEDHKVCMNLLEKAGIYVVADLGEPATSINRANPEWSVDLFQRYKDVVDELGSYDNVIGFFAGNEVTNNNKNTGASAFVKAAVRDTKAYIAQKMKSGHRWMGVGYAANDDADIRVDIAQYFNCGNQDEAIDFWGYNIYSWCGHSSFSESGYDVQVDFFRNYSVPVFFAEYGCNSPGGAEGRLWEDTEALYSDKMTDVINGGIVYMYHQEANDYGLVKVKGDSHTPMKNYQTLKKQMTKVDPKGVDMDQYSATNEPAECPAISKNWKVGGALPPIPDADLCECMSKAASCAVSDSISDKEYGDVFGSICGSNPEACAGIKTDTEGGVYGPFSMCSAKDKLTHVLNAYYEGPGKKADDACSWKGAAKLNPSSTTAGACKASLSKALAEVKVAATATSMPATGGIGNSGSVTGSGDDESSAFSARPFAVTAYVLGTIGAGAVFFL